MDKLSITLAVVLISAITAGHTKTTPNTTESVAPTQKAAKRATSAPPAWIHDVTIDVGTKLATDGDIDAGEATNNFKAGEQIDVAMSIAKVPAGTPVKVVWLRPDGTTIGEETKKTTAGQQYLNFTSPDTKTWPKGEYSIDVWFGNTKAGTLKITIG